MTHIVKVSAKIRNQKVYAKNTHKHAKNKPLKYIMKWKIVQECPRKRATKQSMYNWQPVGHWLCVSKLLMTYDIFEIYSIEYHFVKLDTFETSNVLNTSNILIYYIRYVLKIACVGAEKKSPALCP